MKKTHLVLVKGDRRDKPPHHWHRIIEQAVTGAIHAGFRIGRRVRIGRVEGRVVGYNIGNFGRFGGARYPLLVKTAFGVTKCSPSELAAA